MPTSTSGSPSVAMSQSNTETTRSGSPGTELAIVELVIVVDQCRRAGSAAFPRQASRPSPRSGRCILPRLRASSGRAIPPPAARRSRPACRDRQGQPPRNRPCGGLPAHPPLPLASRMPRSGIPAIDGGASPKMTTPPSRYSGDDEGRADHLYILAQHIGARRAVPCLPQLREDRVLAVHVVRTRRDLAEGRTAQHQLQLPEGEAVGQVGGAARKLRDAHCLGWQVLDIHRAAMLSSLPHSSSSPLTGPWSTSFSVCSRRSQDDRAPSSPRRVFPERFSSLSERV